MKKESGGLVKVVPPKEYNMSKEELFEIHKETSEACLAVMKAKNHDYTAGGSPFANFNASETLDIHPVLGILLRVQDKIMRIKTYTSKGGLAVEGEGVLDSVSDIINYAILVKGMIIEEQRRKGL